VIGGGIEDELSMRQVLLQDVADPAATDNAMAAAASAPVMRAGFPEGVAS